MKVNVIEKAVQLIAPLLVILLASVVHADHSVGDQASLFASVDENMERVDMADMIDGKPLVLVVSSAS